MTFKEAIEVIGVPKFRLVVSVRNSHGFTTEIRRGELSAGALGFAYDWEVSYVRPIGDECVEVKIKGYREFVAATKENEQ